MSLQSNCHECKAGEKIRVTVSGFPNGKATVYLFDEMQAKEAQRILDAPGDEAAIECNHLAHLKPSENSVTWDIESDGVWFVAIDTREIGSAQLTRLPKP